MATISKILITITDTATQPPEVNAKLDLAVAGRVLKHEFAVTLTEARLAQLDALCGAIRDGITEQIRRELVLDAPEPPPPPVTP